MFNRPTKKSINARIFKVEKAIELVQASPDVRLMIEFEYLPVFRQQEIRAKWDLYFQNCKSSPAADRYRIMGLAYKANEFGEVARMAAEAREELATTVFETPEYADPASFHTGNCGTYRFLVKRLAELKQELASFGDRGGSKDEFTENVATALF